MEFTIKPTNMKSTVFLVVTLVGVLIWIATMGGSDKPSSAAPSAAPAAAALPGPALPGMPGSALLPVRRTKTPDDTVFAGNPFLDMTPRESGPPIVEQDGQPVDLVLQGTVVERGRSLALISGRYYAPGDDIGEWRLVWVTPREARLTRDGETLSLRMGRE